MGSKMQIRRGLKLISQFGAMHCAWANSDLHFANEDEASIDVRFILTFRISTSNREVGGRAVIIRQTFDYSSYYLI